MYSAEKKKLDSNLSSLVNSVVSKVAKKVTNLSYIYIYDKNNFQNILGHTIIKIYYNAL